MTDWWNNILSSYQQVLFIIAVATTLIMIIQIIMTFVGAGDDPTFDGSGTDVDFDGGSDVSDAANDGSFGMVFGLRVLSVRSALAFFAIGSWVTFTLCDAMIPWAATLIGVVAGLGAAFLIAFVIKSVEKLQASGNVEIRNAVGKVADVYLTIPPKGKGSGKVSVFVQERLVEFEAISETDEAIKTGAKVKVIGSVNEGLLIVEAC